MSEATHGSIIGCFDERRHGYAYLLAIYRGSCRAVGGCGRERSGRAEETGHRREAERHGGEGDGALEPTGGCAWSVNVLSISELMSGRERGCGRHHLHGLTLYLRNSIFALSMYIVRECTGYTV